MLTVRLFSRASYEAYYIESYQQDEIKKSKKASLQLEKMKLFQGLAGLCLVFFMISTLIRGWIAGWVSIGDFSLVTMLFFSMLGMVWFMSYQITVFVREAGKIKAALALINVPFGITDIKDAKDLSISKGEIEFKNVCFTYQSAVTVFNDISVKINSGEKVGLVGLSGSGKSTFVNLLMRFYDINSGEILVDDNNIAKITRHSLRKNIAMIPQEPTLFHRTLMENIRYGRLNASDEEVLQASIKAHCHEFITQLKEGYDSLVGERGIKLSGGQRQRIAIARAILKNAPILVLDEATSALDSVTEQHIQDSFNQIMQKSTTIVVAHRLSTLMGMDRILVFKQGKVVEDGSMKDLIEQNGHFAKLWHEQKNGFLPDT